MLEASLKLRNALSNVISKLNANKVTYVTTDLDLGNSQKDN
jgi:hypothetical protein